LDLVSVDSDTSSPSATASASTLNDNHDNNNNNNNNPYWYLSSLVRTNDVGNAETWSADLELMHHYTAVTCKTMPTPSELLNIWQLELPRLAASHDFLMHQLLAMSATHMAYLSPDRSNACLIRATQHQNKAIQSLQGTLSAISRDNCHAIFLTASLLSLGAFAALSESPHQKSRPGIDDLLHVFLLIRGMSDIVKSYHDDIAQGPAGQLLQMGQYELASALLLDTAAKLRYMVSVNAANGPLQQGAASLDNCIQQAGISTAAPEFRVSVAWPADLPEGFTTLLRLRSPDALRLLTLYCRILDSVSDDYWYVRGWGASVLRDIDRALLAVS
jgi:hypothetical protein